MSFDCTILYHLIVSSILILFLKVQLTWCCDTLVHCHGNTDRGDNCLPD